MDISKIEFDKFIVDYCLLSPIELKRKYKERYRFLVDAVTHYYNRGYL